MDTGIYIIKNNINDKTYIGSSINIKKRINRHFSDLKFNRHKNIIFQRLYNKHTNNIILSYEILEICSSDKLIEREQFYINTYRGVLLNINKIANSRLGLNNSLDHNKKISKSLKGHKISKETKIKISNTLKGRKLDQDTIKKRCVKINQFSIDGKLIKTWDSIKEASEILDFPRSRIVSCLKFPHLSYKNSFWRHFNSDNKFKFFPKPPGTSRKIALVKNGIIVKEFNTIKEASIELNVNSSKISDVCSGKRKRTGGLFFIYI